MRVLILDDDDARHRSFQRIFQGSGAELNHAYRFSEFLRALKGNSPYDLILLDHDLGIERQGDFFFDGNSRRHEFTGEHAARSILELPKHRWPTTIIVHSMNELGSRRMVALLQKAGIYTVRRPFDFYLRH